MVSVRYADGDPDEYLVPVAHADSSAVHKVLEWDSEALIARLEVQGAHGFLYDAMIDPGFESALLDAIAERRRFRGGHGLLVGIPAPGMKRLRGSAEEALDATLFKAEQSNNSVVFGERLMLKLFRRHEPGMNPELEMTRFLSETHSFSQFPTLAGWLEYRDGQREPGSVAVLQGYVPNHGDAWRQASAAFDEFVERTQRRVLDGQPLQEWTSNHVAPWEHDIPAAVRAEVGEYLNWAALLGRRTAEMHLALASDPTLPAFAPEASTMLEQRSAYQSIRSLGLEAMRLLRSQTNSLPETARDEARILLSLEGDLLARIRSIIERPIGARRIRCHGDYHLGQVLFTGADFVVIDFEGEPGRTLRDRRRKRWPARDVAGLVRSYDYVVQTALANRPELAHTSAGWDVAHAANLWIRAVNAAFVTAYRETAGGPPLLSRTLEEDVVLLHTMLIEKALYELRYELNNRPSWVGIPVRGLLDLLGMQR